MPRRPASTLQQLMNLSVDAPFVAGQRLSRMAVAAHAPTVSDKLEFSRMSEEKFRAAVEGWWAMSWAMLEWQQRALRTWWMPGTAQRMARGPGMRALDDIFAAGLRPASRAVAANRRRLSARSGGTRKRR